MIFRGGYGRYVALYVNVKYIVGGSAENENCEFFNCSFDRDFQAGLYPAGFAFLMLQRTFSISQCL